MPKLVFVDGDVQYGEIILVSERYKDYINPNLDWHDARIVKPEPFCGVVCFYSNFCHGMAMRRDGKWCEWGAFKNNKKESSEVDSKWGEPLYWAYINNNHLKG